MSDLPEKQNPCFIHLWLRREEGARCPSRDVGDAHSVSDSHSGYGHIPTRGNGGGEEMSLAPDEYTAVALAMDTW